jgi:hypothetical protein
MNYYNKYKSWPRTWSPYNFTDLGLNPSDWANPVDCVVWAPSGVNIGLANRVGDNIQLYVNKIHANGQAFQLYDGWTIWCVANTSVCYYHTVAPGNEVDISTLVAVIQ